MQLWRLFLVLLESINCDCDSDIGGKNDISLSEIATLFSVFSSKHLDFWQNHNSSVSYSKASDSIYVALRGSRKPFSEVLSGMIYDTYWCWYSRLYGYTGTEELHTVAAYRYIRHYCLMFITLQ